MTRAAAGGPAVPFGEADIAVAVAMNLLWGLNIVALKVTVAALAPFAAGAARLLAIALLCLPWMRPPPGQLRVLLLYGLVTGGLFLLFMNLALGVATNVGALAIVGQLAVPIGILLGALFLHERTSRAQLAGVALAFAGVVLLLFDRRLFGELPGIALMLLAATAWALSSFIQRCTAGVSVSTLFFWNGLVGAALLLPLSLWLEPGVLARVPRLDWYALGWLAFSILGSTLAGQGGMAWLLRRHPLSAVMPLTLASPVVSVTAAHLVFGTPVTASMLVGGLVTLGGVVMVTVARRRTLLEAGG